MPTPVSEFATTPVLTVENDTTVAEAVDALAAKEIHSLVVISADCQPTGVFTSTDLIDVVASDATLSETTVGEHATTDVITVSPDDSVESVAATMHDHDVGHVPVVDDQVVGIVTESDLREYLAGQVVPAE